MQNKAISGFFTLLRRIDKATIKTIKELKTLKAYETKRYKCSTALSFNEALVYYLSNGEPEKIAGIRNTSIKVLHKYYLLKRVNDLNSLIDYIAYLKYLKRLEEKNAGKT